MQFLLCYVFFLSNCVCVYTASYNRMSRRMGCRWKMKVNEAGRRAGAVGKGLFRLISSSRDREIGTRGQKSVVKNETLKPR